MQHPVLDWVVSSFHLPDPGVERWSPALQADALLSEPPGNPKLASLVAQLVNLSSVGDPGFIPGLGRPSGEGKGCPLQYSWASLVAQLVKNPPAVWETWVLSLGREDPLEKGKATHSSIWPGELWREHTPILQLCRHRHLGRRLPSVPV